MSPYQPELRTLSHAWRLVVCIALGLVVWLPVMENQADQHPALFWIDLTVGIASLVLVHWRRRWPVTIALITTLTIPISSFAAGAQLLAIVSMATRRVWFEIVAIGALTLAATGLYYRVQPVPDADPAWLLILITVAAIAGSLAWGMYIGSRRELIWTLHQRAETAETERDNREAQARASERTRIAREMHDVLAHRISQISLHAGALTFREDLDLTEMRASLGVIQSTAHEALTDLRSVLGVLRDADGVATDRPQPTYDDLAVLIDECRAAGTTITFAATGTEAVPTAVGRAVYRIVQESITNARKHAPAAAVSVTLRGGTDGLDITISNRLGFTSATPGAGLGLVGLAERAALAGGWLEHSTDDGHFVVRAWLPWAS